MKVQRETDGTKRKIVFIPETEEEKLLMGTLRNHFFFGLPENGTYPEYDSMTTEKGLTGERVTSLSLKFNAFKNKNT